MAQPQDAVSRTSLVNEGNPASSASSAEGSPVVAAMQLSTSQKIPSDKVGMTFLLISGERSLFAFGQKETIDNIKKYIFTNWPKEFGSELPESTNNMRVLYRGRYLEGPSTLESHNFPLAENTTVHLLLKTQQPESDEQLKTKESPLKQCCQIL